MPDIRTAAAEYDAWVFPLNPYRPHKEKKEAEMNGEDHTDVLQEPETEEQGEEPEEEPAESEGPSKYDN